MSVTSQDGPSAVCAGPGLMQSDAALREGTSIRRRHGRLRLRIYVALGMVVALTVGVVAMLLTGWLSGPPTAFSALASALGKTAGESYSFSLTSTVTYAGQKMSSDAVSGAFDPKHDLGTEFLAENIAQSSEHTQRAQIRFIGNYVYTQVSPDSGSGNPGKPWNSAPVPPAETDVFAGGTPYGFATDQPLSPNALLVAIRSTATVLDSGPASGPGYSGERYTFTSRPSSQWSINGTAYVDKQGQVRRLITITAQENGLTTLRDITFSRLGATVAVTAPPIDQVWYTNKAYWGFYF